MAKRAVGILRETCVGRDPSVPPLRALPALALALVCPFHAGLEGGGDKPALADEKSWNFAAGGHAALGSSAPYVEFDLD